MLIISKARALLINSHAALVRKKKIFFYRKKMTRNLHARPVTR